MCRLHHHQKTAKGTIAKAFDSITSKESLLCYEIQCDQVPKLQNRQIFAENRHDWRVNFRPQILPAKLPATIRNRLISSYFYPFFLHFYEVRLIIT